MKKVFLFLTFIFVAFGATNAQTNCKKGYAEDYKVRAFLGIYSDDVSREKAEALGFENPYGDLVTGILLNTAAAEIGLQPLDYIYGLDGFRVSREQGLSDILRRYSSGDKAELLYIRKGKKMKSELVFRSRSESKKRRIDDCKQAFFGVWLSGTSRHVDGVKVDIGRKTTAGEMGLEDGDVILTMNGYKIFDWGDLSAFVDGLIMAGDILHITYYRDGKYYEAQQRVMSYAEYHECDGCDCGRDDFANYDGTKGFEEKMERFGENMEKWGERFGEKMERFGETFEVHMEDLADDIEEIFDGDDDGDDREYRRAYSSLNISVGDVTESDARSFHPGDGSKLPVANDLDINDLKISYNGENGRLGFSFSLPVSGYTLVRIYSSSSRLVYDFDLGDFSGRFEDDTNIGRSGTGTYYFVVVHGNRSVSRKIVLE